MVRVLVVFIEAGRRRQLSSVHAAAAVTKEPILYGEIGGPLSACRQEPGCTGTVVVVCGQGGRVQGGKGEAVVVERFVALKGPEGDTTTPLLASDLFAICGARNKDQADVVRARSIRYSARDTRRAEEVSAGFQVA